MNTCTPCKRTTSLTCNWAHGPLNKWLIWNRVGCSGQLSSIAQMTLKSRRAFGRSEMKSIPFPLISTLEYSAIATTLLVIVSRPLHADRSNTDSHTQLRPSSFLVTNTYTLNPVTFSTTRVKCVGRVVCLSHHFP